MGNSCSGTKLTEEEKREKKMNRALGVQLKREFRQEELITKVLLLGTGESGKSTIFKQARSLFGKGFTAEELEQFRPKIYHNIVLQMKAVLSNRRSSGVEFSDLSNTEKEDLILSLDVKKVCRGNFEAPVVDALKALWKDPAVKSSWFNRSSYQVFDCVEYYLSDEVLNRVSAVGYLPSFLDVLNCRDVTTGVVVERFKMSNRPFEMYDVGGQRSERRKWLGCFDNVTTVIYVTAINEFDQFLYEDESINRFDEALKVWSDIVNRDDFKSIGFVLFLNKVDLFRDKLKTHKFKSERWNKDFTGREPCELQEGSPEQQDAIEKCMKYLEEKFAAAVIDGERRLGVINAFPTIATDSETMEKVFDTCQEQLLRITLQAGGFANLTI